MAAINSVIVFSDSIGKNIGSIKCSNNASLPKIEPNTNPNIVLEIPKRIPTAPNCIPFHL